LIIETIPNLIQQNDRCCSFFLGKDLKARSLKGTEAEERKKEEKKARSAKG
jgi:hypothetical protein